MILFHYLFTFDIALHKFPDSEFPFSRHMAGKMVSFHDAHVSLFTFISIAPLSNNARLLSGAPIGFNTIISACYKRRFFQSPGILKCAGTRNTFGMTIGVISRAVRRAALPARHYA